MYLGRSDRSCSFRYLLNLFQLRRYWLAPVYETGALGAFVNQNVGSRHDLTLTTGNFFESTKIHVPIIFGAKRSLHNQVKG